MESLFRTHKSTITGPSYKDSIFACKKFISLKIVVPILLVVKGILPNDLERMLSLSLVSPKESGQVKISRYMRYYIGIKV